MGNLLIQLARCCQPHSRRSYCWLYYSGTRDNQSIIKITLIIQQSLKYRPQWVTIIHWDESLPKQYPGRCYNYR